MSTPEPQRNQLVGRAIGLIDSAYSSSVDEADDAIRELARTLGLHLVEVLTIAEDTFMPTTLIIATVHRHNATAILAPALTHLGPKPAALALAADLFIPGHSIARRPGWTPNP